MNARLLATEQRDRAAALSVFHDSSEPSIRAKLGVRNLAFAWRIIFTRELLPPICRIKGKRRRHAKFRPYFFEGNTRLSRLTNDDAGNPAPLLRIR
jgi:hypothetical protein